MRVCYRNIPRLARRSFCREGASLMPSPKNPTICPRSRRAKSIRVLCAGHTRANTLALFNAWASAISVIPSIRGSSHGPLA